MSLPAVNAVPAPANITARIDGSELASSRHRAASAYIARVNAFFLSGRSNVMVSTASLMSLRMDMSACLCQKLQSLEDAGCAHAGANAHGHHSVATLMTAQTMDHRR